jgi:PP-loop superfamily ATP-utilizing enzyme
MAIVQDPPTWATPHDGVVVVAADIVVAFEVLGTSVVEVTVVQPAKTRAATRATTMIAAKLRPRPRAIG